MPNQRPSPELLRKLLRYEPDTGKLYWRSRTPDMFTGGKRPVVQRCQRWNSRYAGEEAMKSNSNGYKHGQVLQATHKAHRVIWAIFHGYWPIHEVDHIYGDRADNRISMLRSVSPQGNSRNKKTPCNNTSGHLGVSWRKQVSKWSASIGVDGKDLNLGYFIHKADAIAARKAAEVKYGFHKNHGRKS